jgi:hypothetical protein
MQCTAGLFFGIPTAEEIVTMSAIVGTLGLTATKVASRAICPHVGYYFMVTPRLESGRFWVGPYPDHASANQARRKNYAHPRYDTNDPWYFNDGGRMF